MRRLFPTWLIVVAVSLGHLVTTAAQTRIADEDVACRVSEKAIQKFAACVFPMEFRGTKEVQVGVLGAAVTNRVPWEARVSKPVIRITQRSQTFTASVEATAAGVPWKGDVNGTLDITYSNERKAIVVAVRDAIVPIRVGPLALDVDVSEEIPELPFAIPMPELAFPFKDKQVRVRTNPRLRFIDDAVIVVTDTTFAAE